MRDIVKGTLLCALLATTSFAGENRSGLYFGGGIGSANYNDGDISEVLANSKVETSADGMKGYLGYQFNNVIGLELGYADYGKYEASEANNDYSYSAQSYSVAANLGYSFLDSQIRPFFNLGLAYIQTKHENLDPFYNSIKDSAIGAHYGIGIQYEPNILRGLGFRIAYEADSYMTSVQKYTYSSGSGYYSASSSDEIYTQTNSLIYGAIQYKF